MGGMADRDSAQSGSVGVYLRVSTDHQTTENQRPDLDRYVSGYGLTPYGTYEDEAISGKWVPFGQRPEGKRLLADAKAGHVSLVLVWRLDRFGRNAYEILGAVRELEQAGARLISLKEQFDTRTAAGKLMLGVLAAVAEFEAESITERAGAGIVRRLNDGGWLGGHAAYGYRVDGRGSSARLMPDETPLTLPDGTVTTPAGIVRLVYSMLVEQNMTTIAVADELNRRAIPTPFVLRGRRYRKVDPNRPASGVWLPNTVNSMVSNPVYKGEYLFGRRSANLGRTSAVRSGGAHPDKRNARPVMSVAVPALVSTEVWDAAQAVMHSHVKFSPRNAKREYLLRGLMKCGECGMGYVGDTDYYTCYGHRRARTLWGTEQAEQRRCSAVGVNAADIEADVWGDVEYWVRHPDEALALITAQQGDQASAADSVRADIASKQQELDGYQLERDGLYTYYRKGKMSERDLDRQKDLIAAEEVKLAKQIADLSKKLNDIDDEAARMAGAEALLRELAEGLDSGQLSRRYVVEKLVKRIIVHTESDPDTGYARARIEAEYAFNRPSTAGITTCSPCRGRTR